MSGEPPLIELPDGRTVPDRRQQRRPRFLERAAAEPLASIAIGLTLAVLAWGTITSNTRNATEARSAAVNAKAAADTAEAARQLSESINLAQDALAAVESKSRVATYSTQEAIQDTVICVAQTLAFRDADRPVTPEKVQACKAALTPPPADPPPKKDGTPTTTATR